ncbi:hypothetical protein HPB51_008331 [Rhipicephalus microplus]|uniref:Methyltransferase domain-containing protein n=1 Tax=Rhipicephalus microplus TaxID=6941 RepID=A0A9J6ES75_RHIMP|nr:hypothetical protein HPB51_008331 [Rhipicephalus microplus]
MKFNRDDYASFNHYFSQFEDELLKKIRFRSPLTENQQVLEVGSGTGHFASLFLTHHCEPCKRIVATDFDPAMMDFARKHFSHEQIVYDTLDITSHSLRFRGRVGGSLQDAEMDKPFTDMLLTVVPFKAIVPAEEWTDFVDLWTQLLHRKLCPEPGQPLALKFAVYVVHGCRATAQ